MIALNLKLLRNAVLLKNLMNFPRFNYLSFYLVQSEITWIFLNYATLLLKMESDNIFKTKLLMMFTLKTDSFLLTCSPWMQLHFQCKYPISLKIDGGGRGGGGGARFASDRFWIYPFASTTMTDKSKDRFRTHFYNGISNWTFKNISPNIRCRK